MASQDGDVDHSDVDLDSPGARGGGSGRRSAVIGGVLVTVVLAAAGFLFATSASTARGTDLRSDRNTELVDLIREEQGAYDDGVDRLAALRDDVDALTAKAADRDERVATALDAAAALEDPAGLRELTGPGLEVTLDDAPREPGDQLPEGVTPDDLVVHQQDLQAVINAMWSGGAEAVQVMDQRLIATSAVRCVGNTLILHGRVYSPPYVVTGIGDVAGMTRAMDESPQLGVYRDLVEAVGLGLDVAEQEEVTVPAYDGALDLRWARSSS